MLCQFRGPPQFERASRSVSKVLGGGFPPSRISRTLRSHCGLTPRSTGPATAGGARLARSGFATVARQPYTARLRGPVTSNVRPRISGVMLATVEEGYSPGCIGRVAQLHADYYSRSSDFGVQFEAKVAQEFSAFCLNYTQGRDGLWFAKNPSIEGSIAIDGSKAAETGAHLRWFITSETLRSQGIGKVLLGRALDFANKVGFKSVHLWTFSGLGAARHLYEANGFRLVEERPGNTWGKIVLEQRFVRGVA
jgi:GNAT superfamily N-acetyltransferase